MKKFYLTCFVLLLTVLCQGQINAILRDSITRKSVAFAAISNEKLKISKTSSAEGFFELLDLDSATVSVVGVGYYPKTLKLAGSGNTVLMRSKPRRESSNVTLTGKKTNRTGRVRTELSMYRKGATFPKAVVAAKFFPYKPKYAKTPYLSTVSYCISSQIDNAVYRLHVFDVNPDGTPGDDLLPDDLLLTAEKGEATIDADFSNKGIAIGPRGIFIGIETLDIPQNETVSRHEKMKECTLPVINGVQAHRYIQPTFLGEAKNTGTLWIFQDGKWVHRTEKIAHDTKYGRHYEFNSPYIELTLTN